MDKMDEMDKTDKGDETDVTDKIEKAFNRTVMITKVMSSKVPSDGVSD